MRKQLNRLLIKFGLLITKAPTFLTDKSLETSDAFPAELTEKVTVVQASDAPENPSFDAFSADTNVHKWHHYFDIYTIHFDQYRDRPTNYWLKHVDSENTFFDLAKQMVDMLHEPYIDRKEKDFRHGHPEAVTQLELSYLAANLACIAFYDSIVVIDKKKQHLPKAELRQGR